MGTLEGGGRLTGIGGRGTILQGTQRGLIQHRDGDWLGLCFAYYIAGRECALVRILFSNLAAVSLYTVCPSQISFISIMTNYFLYLPEVACKHGPNQ
jgi:hypothetical protein